MDLNLDKNDKSFNSQTSLDESSIKRVLSIIFGIEKLEDLEKIKNSPTVLKFLKYIKEHDAKDEQRK